MLHLGLGRAKGLLANTVRKAARAGQLDFAVPEQDAQPRPLVVGQRSRAAHEHLGRGSEAECECEKHQDGNEAVNAHCRVEGE